MFTDDPKMVGITADVEIIQSYLLKMAEWVVRNGMILNASKIQYQHFGPSPSLSLLFPNQNGIHVPLPQVMVKKDLNVIVDAAVAKSMKMLAFM